MVLRAPLQPTLTVEHPTIPGLKVVVQRPGRLYTVRWSARFRARASGDEAFELSVEMLIRVVVDVVGLEDEAGPMVFGAGTRDEIIERLFEYDLDVEPRGEATENTFAEFILERVLDRQAFGDAFSRSRERKDRKTEGKTGQRA